MPKKRERGWALLCATKTGHHYFHKPHHSSLVPTFRTRELARNYKRNLSVEYLSHIKVRFVKVVITVELLSDFRC